MISRSLDDDSLVNIAVSEVNTDFVLLNRDMEIDSRVSVRVL